MTTEQKTALRALPSLDALLQSEECRPYLEAHTLNSLKPALKEALETARRTILNGGAGFTKTEIIASAEKLLTRRAQPQRVINATGIAINTNLGRSPLSKKAREAVLDACGYSNLEFSLKTGERSARGEDAEKLICKLTGAEAALCVNNNAAALLLASAALSNGKAGVISRGELVEIGGSFRILDILKASGAPIMEIGSTNRTHEADYIGACQSGGAGFVLKVHTSNYIVNGFAKEVSLKRVCEIAGDAKICVVADLGSGAIMPQTEYPFAEPCAPGAIKDGADIVCFSGDKLLGGPQCGIICGKKEQVEKMRRHPLARALRIDKLCLAALSATLAEYISPESAKQSIPVLKMLTQSGEQSQLRAQKLAALLQSAGAQATVIEVRRPVGGGSVPDFTFAGFAAAIACKAPEELSAKLLTAKPPIVAYVREGCLILDPLCFDDEDFSLAAEAVQKLL